MADPVGFLARLFDTSDFPARWTSGHWTPALGWLHILSDLAVFGACTAIPAVLAFFVLRRPDSVFPKVFWLVGAFVFLCGAGHLVEATTFWQPWYRFSGVVKLTTALVSWATVVVLWRVTPAALRLPSLAAVNARLSDEIEQRKRTEDRLERTSRELRAFAYVASHDLRAPLRAVRNLATWVIEDCEGEIPAAAQAHLSTMQGRIGRMERMLDDLLLYARTPPEEADADEIDTADAVRQLVEVLDVPEAFEVRVDAMPRACVPLAPFQQVMKNLVQNAIRHHDRTGGRVIVSGSEVAGGWEFQVEDDGPGIPSEHAERVFEIFQTLRPRDEVETSGIGLAIVRKILNTHGGTVRVAEPRGPRGARLIVTWPALPKEEAIHA